MAIPDFQTLMLPTLKIGSTGEVTQKAAINLLSDQFELTPEDRVEMLPSGTMTTIKNRVAWAISYLFQAKLVSRPARGVFTITERGKQLLQDAPERIDIKFLERYPEFVDFRYKRKS